MKKLIIIIFLLKCTLAFSQDFNDKLITTTGDTIRCQVTSVNNDNVFYYIIVKNKINNGGISLMYVKKIIIDKSNNPLILLKGKRDTIITLGKQDSLLASKKLIVERTKLLKNQLQPTRVTFMIGNKVAIEKYNYKTISGLIENISDSSIQIKGKEIKIKDIKRINKIRGITSTIIGLSCALSAGIFFLIISNYQPAEDNNGNYVYGNDYTVFVIICITSTLTGFVALTAGIIDIATIKYYRMDKNWKIVISK